jgi:hypothetical protein
MNAALSATTITILSISLEKQPGLLRKTLTTVMNVSLQFADLLRGIKLASVIDSHCA